MKEFLKSNTASFHEAEAMLNSNINNRINLLNSVLPMIKPHGFIVLSMAQPGVHYGQEVFQDHAMANFAMGRMVT